MDRPPEGAALYSHDWSTLLHLLKEAAIAPSNLSLSVSSAALLALEQPGPERRNTSKERPPTMSKHIWPWYFFNLGDASSDPVELLSQPVTS